MLSLSLRTHFGPCVCVRYEDLQVRIPRAEVTEIERTVKHHVHKMVPGAGVQACGSYRRGKSSCGDVDILICHPGGECDVLSTLIKRLHTKGLLTHDLSMPDAHTSGGSSGAIVRVGVDAGAD